MTICEECKNPPPVIAPFLANVGGKNICVNCAMKTPEALKETLRDKLIEGRRKERNRRKRASKREAK